MLPMLNPKYGELARKYQRLHYERGAYSETHKDLIFAMALYLALPVLSRHTFVSVNVPHTTPETELKQELFDVIYEGSKGCLYRDDVLSLCPGIIGHILQLRAELAARGDR